MLNIGLETQQRVLAPNGDVLWSGAQVLANTFAIKVAAAGTTIKMSEIVQFDSTNSVIPRPETTAASGTPTSDLPMSLALYGNVSPAVANSVNLIGVAQEPIAALQTGLVAGYGSLVCVKCLAAGPLTVGTFVSSSATAGAAGVAAATAGLNNILGAVFKINQVASPGSGSTTWAGIHICGGSAAIS